MDQYKSEMLSFMREAEAYAAMPDKAMLERNHATTYTIPFNFTGQPAVVVRAHTAPDGMPVGVQIAARRWREDVALALALRVEASLGGWKAPTTSVNLS